MNFGKSSLAEFKKDVSRFKSYVYSSDEQEGRPAMSYSNFSLQFDKIYVRTTVPSIVILKAGNSMSSFDNIYRVERRTEKARSIYRFYCGAPCEGALAKYNQVFCLACS